MARKRFNLVPGDWIQLEHIIRKLGNENKLTALDSPTFVGLTLTGLTASSLVVTDADKALASLALPLAVNKGGTGVATLTNHGILLGSGTGTVTPLGAASNGQIPIGSTGADPTLATITGTTNQVTVANAAGSITLSLPQNIHAGASPTFVGLTLSSIAAEGTDVDKFLVDSTGIIKYRTGAQVLSDIGASASAHLHDGQTLQHDGVNSDGGAFSFATTGTVSFNQTIDFGSKVTAGSWGSPIDVTNTRKYGFELHYSGNNYDVFGIRSRANLITTDASTRTATGAELQAANTDGIDVNVLCGAKCSSTGKSTSSSATISYMRAVDLITEYGAKDTITNLYNTHIKCITRNAAGEGSFTTGYGIYLENIAVGGTGQALDAGIYFKATSFATPSFTYGIDFTGATYATADIKIKKGILLTDACTIGQTNGPLLTFDDTANSLKLTGGNIQVYANTDSWRIQCLDAQDAGRAVIDVQTTHGTNIICSLRSHDHTYSETFFGLSMAGVGMLWFQPQTTGAIIGTYSNFPLIFGVNNVEHSRMTTTSFQPASDNTFDLGVVGGTDYRWRHLYLSGNLSDETNSLTIANAKAAYDHSQIAGGDSVHVSVAENTAWDAAYTHSQLTAGNPHSVTPTELSLVIGTNVQAYGAVLDDLNTLGANSADSEFLVGTGAGALIWESGNTARTSLGLGTGDGPRFTQLAVGGYAVGANIVYVTDPSGNDRFKITTTEVVLNEDLRDMDFRVESTGHAHSLFVRGSDGNIGIGHDVPSYHLSIGGSSGTDQIGIYHNETDAYFTTTDGAFTFITDEGTNTHTYFSIKGKGTGATRFQLYNGDNSGSLLLYRAGNYGYVKLSGGTTSGLLFQEDAACNIACFGTVPEGTYPEFLVYGFRTGDARRSLQIGVGRDAADTVSFDGLSNYRFDGNGEFSGNLGAGTFSPAAQLDVLGPNDGNLIFYAHHAAASVLEINNAGFVFNNDHADMDFRIESDNDTYCFFLDAGLDAVGIGNTPVGKLYAEQGNAAGAKPVLGLKQVDVSEEFIRFIGTSADGVLTQSIVEAADVGTATLAGYVKVYVQDDGEQLADQAYYQPVYTLA